MPSNTKEDNQWIGKYFELCSTERINGVETIPDPQQYKSIAGYNFSEQEKCELFTQAKKVSDFIGPGHHAEWIGEHTVKGKGDILLDDTVYIELKHVWAGASTYHNTTMFYLDNFGIDFNTYLNKYQLRELIQELNPDIEVSFFNHSPIGDKTIASMIHDERPKIYAQMVAIDKKMRKELTADLVNLLKNNFDLAQIFYTDMVSKYKVSQGVASAADRFIVYNYKIDTIKEFDLQKIQNGSAKNIKANQLGFWIGDIKIQVGWQNNVGCNPTLRVFLQ